MQAITAIQSTDTAVVATNIQAPTILQYLTVTSGQSIDGSSYGVLARESDGLRILDSFITASEGVNGASGSSGAPGGSGTAGGNGGNGVEDSSFIGCQQGSRPQPGAGGSPNGGDGGSPGLGSGGGANGNNAFPGGAGGGGGATTVNGQNGFDGENGAAATDGQPGRANYFTAGYRPVDGTNGAEGRNGGGGGGGGGGGRRRRWRHLIL